MRHQCNSNKIFLVSGIEPSRKGAGKFIGHFINILQNENVNLKVYYIATPENSIVKLFKRIGLIKPLKELYYYFKRRNDYLNNIHNSTIFLFHPQSLGLKSTKALIKNNNRIFFYVLDNFFFCKKSYNHIHGENIACFRCLNDMDESLKNDCKPFPNYYTHLEYISFIDFLKTHINKITFLTQNENQNSLLKEKFENDIKILKLGMNTGEIEINKKNVNKMKFDFDFLYHNTLSSAKGLSFFISLCKSLPQYKFVIPYSKRDVEKLIGKIDLHNLIFSPCSWDNGLLELMNRTKITIVPSLWSAPVEGALLKSLYYANAVAVIRSKFSFASEIPNEICIELSENIESSKTTLKLAIQNNICLHDKSSKCVVDYIRNVDDKFSKFARNLTQEID